MLIGAESKVTSHLIVSDIDSSLIFVSLYVWVCSGEWPCLGFLWDRTNVK